MSSQGAIFNLNIKKVNYEDIKNFKNEYKIISSTLSEKSVNFTDLKLENNQKYIVVFGNESRGISEETIKLTDIFTKIPMNSIDSLNVGVAAGIIIYYLAIENKLY
jgi:TrmH family RNA methyltransferase